MKRLRCSRQPINIFGLPVSGMGPIGYILIFLLVWMVSSARAEWKEYAISNGAFAISMPVPPVIEMHRIDTGSGRIDAHIVMAKRGPSVAYAVVYCEYPREALFCTAPERYLDTASDQMVRKMNGDLISESSIRMDGFPGRQIKMTLPDGLLHLKLYAVGRRSYQVYAVALDGAGSHEDARRFLSSFRLLKTLSRRNTGLSNP